MPPLFHKNSILTGCLDHYCLVCEAHLKGEHDITGHIAKPIHKKNLDAAAYVDKFADDCVRKVKKGYYCEYCNILVTTAAKVNLHVADQKHIFNKGSSLLRRTGASVIAFQDVLIDEKAWHGLIEETCATCNTEFDNEQIHKTEPNHILSLVQCKVEFGAGKAVYRKIDDSSFQCLTCNYVLALSELDSHFKQSEHKDLIHLIEDKTDKETVTDDKKINSSANKALGKAQDSKSNVQTEPKKLNYVAQAETKAQEKLQDKKTDTQTESKKKSESFQLKFHFGDPPKKKTEAKTETIAPTKKVEPKKGVTEEVNKTATVETETQTKKKVVGPIKLSQAKNLEEQICKVLGAKDYVADDQNGKKWCLLCDWTMEIDLLEAHILGRHHKHMSLLHKRHLLHKSNAVTTGDEELARNYLATNDDIYVDHITETVVCKKCSFSFNYRNPDAILNHIQEHKKAESKKDTPVVKQEVTNEIKKATPTTVTKTPKENDLKQANVTPKTTEIKKKPSPTKSPKSNENKTERSNSVGSKEEDIEKYAKANELVHSRGGTKVYCRKCDTKIPFSLKNMKEHVSGLSHKKKTGITQTPKPKVKTPTKNFIKNFIGLEKGVFQDVIINEKFCINIISFCFFMKYSEYGIKCLACDVRCENFAEMASHQDLPPHQWAMCEALVVSSFDTEFLRELRPDVLHCGYCNTLIESEDLDDHLLTVCHREAKTNARWRLHQYMPEVAQHRRQQDLNVHVLMKSLMNGSSFFNED